MGRWTRTAGLRVGELLFARPRLTLFLLLMLALFAVQGGVTAIDPDCSTCVGTTGGGAGDGGPDEP